jgi:two-component system, sensor histidine kinase
MSCFYAGAIIPTLNFLRTDVRFDGDTLAFGVVLLTVAASTRLNHKNAILWLCVSLGMYYLVQFKMFVLQIGPYDTNQKVNFQQVIDPVKVNLQVLQTGLIAYCMFRINDARERKLFLRELTFVKSAEERLQFLQSIGHDLRQPLTAITLHCDFARKAFYRQDETGLNNSIDIVQQNLIVLNSELMQITEIAEIAQEAAAFPLHIVDLNLMLRSLQRSFALRAEDAGILLTYANLKTSALGVFSNEILLRKVFTNLIHNALKYTEVSTRGVVKSVHISVANLGESAVVKFIDTGSGINPDKLSQIWEPFFQIANPERNRDRGFGLGLAHVKAAIDRLPEHSISVESHVDRGTTFTVCMPLADVEELDLALANSALEASDEAISISGSFVMVLEDDVVLRQALVQALHQFEARAVSAHDLASARLLYSKLEVPPDVVIVDHRLPDGNGREFILEINKLCATNAEVGPQIIYLSGEHSSALNLSGLVNTTLVRKPVDFAMLKRAVYAALRRAE